MDNKKVTVLVSALALAAAPFVPANATMTISCTRGISFGRIVPSCAGTITVRGTASSVTINNGCHSLVGGAIRPGICTIRTTAQPTATENARITFLTAALAFSNGASGTVTLDNYRIQLASGGSTTNTHTFNSGLLDPAHSFRVGGRMRFGAAEPVGSYSSSLSIVVTAIP
jgi:hypothetical protein